MNKEIARSLLMEYLYDELDASQKKEFEKALLAHPELQVELNELSDVRSVLSHLPVESPEEKITVVAASQKKTWADARELLLPTGRLAKAGLALAACLVLFAIVGAFTKMSFTFNESGFQISFGEPIQATTQTFDPAQLEELVSRIQEENTLMMAEYVKAAQQLQNEKIEESFASFAEYVEHQRTSDLKLISSDLTSLEETYYNRYRQTNQVLGEIIQTVSNRN